MTSVNLYDVLNISEDSNIQTIKSAYKDLAKLYHPDKATGDKDMFELVTHAYTILINPSSKDEYDKIHNLSKTVNSSHFDLKTNAESYYNSLEEKKADLKDEDKDKLLLNNKESFKKSWDTLDKKHGYKRGITDNKLSDTDTKRKLQDLMLSRDQDLIEVTPDELFDRSSFNLATFNAAFDQAHMGINSLVPHNGAPGAWNGDSNTSSFSTLENYEDLYVEDSNTSNIDKDNIKKKLNKKDIKKLEPVDYTTKHNFREADYTKSLEDRLKERELETKMFDDRTMDKFDTDPDCGGFGIFSKLGMDGAVSNLSLENDKDLKDKYTKLLSYRNNESKQASK